MPIAPPRPKNLPLNALRAFEAAARLKSFVAAAEELGVSAGAVAAHIKGLEAEIGAPLFERQAHGIALTPLAGRLLPDFVAAFDALGAATQRLRTEAAPRVHIAALPAVAQLWLSPRLPALRAAAPDIAVSITAMERPPNLKRVPFDLSIFYRPAGEGQALDDDVIFPVCAPSLAAGLQEPANLLTATCLTDATWADDWTKWTQKAAPGLNFAPRGPLFSLYALAVTEAINGAGVLMGHEALIRDDLATGRLVAPFATRVTLPRRLSIANHGPGARARRRRPRRGAAESSALIDLFRVEQFWLSGVLQPAVFEHAIEAAPAPGMAGGPAAGLLHRQQEDVLVAIGGQRDQLLHFARGFALLPQRLPRGATNSGRHRSRW